MFDFIVIPIVLFFLCISFGMIMKKILGFKDEKNALIVGFVAFFASFFIISTPFMLFDLKLSDMITIVEVFYGIIMIIGFVLICKYLKSNAGDIRKNYNTFYENKYQLVLFTVFIIMVIYQVGHIVCFQHSDIDDSYYLAQSNTYSYTNYVSKVEPSSGLSFLTASKQYALVSFEIIYAILNRVFGVNIAYLAHTIWPVFAIICHYVVIYNIAKKVNASMKWEFCILYSIINLFSGFTAYAGGAFLLNRVWQGKTIFVAIFIPILIMEFMDIYEKNSFRNIIYLWMILLAGISTTTVAIYLFPILYFVMWLGYGIAKRSIKSLMQLCIPIAGIMPWVFIKLKMMYLTGNSGVSVQQSVTGGAEGMSYSRQLYDRFLSGHSIVIVGYIIALTIICVYADKKIKSIFLYPAIVLFVTFANPFLVKYVAKWVTGVDVYWRIFWLFSMSMTIIIASILILNICVNEREKILGTAIVSVAILSCGTSVFENGGWENRSNMYKLDSKAVKIADSIHKDLNKNVNNTSDGTAYNVSEKNAYNDLEKNSHKDSDENSGILLLPKDMSYGIREYCGDIYTIVNRYSYESFRDNNMSKEYGILLKEIYNPLYVDKKWDAGKLEEQINNFNIAYVVLYADSAKNNQIPAEFTVIYRNSEYILYRCK